jgi:hypothetical protein
VTAPPASIDERGFSAFALRAAALRSAQVQRQAVLRPAKSSRLGACPITPIADRLRERALGSAERLELAQQRIRLLCTGQVTAIE